VLALRAEKATLLGYANFAEVSMASKMATLPRARELLEQLRAASFAAARADLADVQAHAAAAGFAGELRHWDVSFYAERLKEAKYAISDEELRPYFPLPAVLDGLFAVAKRLFDVDIEAADGQAPVWHADVRFFKVKKGGQDKAFFYLDPYSRPAEKRGGAWMDEVRGREEGVYEKAFLKNNNRPLTKSIPRLDLNAGLRAERALRGARAGGPPPGRAHGLQPDAARRRRALAHDLPRGRDALPRVWPRRAAHAHRAARGPGRRHPRR